MNPGVIHEKYTSYHTTSLYHPDQRLALRLSVRKDLPGQVQICLCAGTELLFLPRGRRILPHRRAAGSVKPERISDPFRGTGLFLPLRKPSGTDRMRMALSFRAGAGSSPPDPCFSEKKETAFSPNLNIWKICGSSVSRMHRLHVPVRRLCQSSGIL